MRTQGKGMLPTGNAQVVGDLENVLVQFVGSGTTLRTQLYDTRANSDFKRRKQAALRGAEITDAVLTQNQVVGNAVAEAAAQFHYCDVLVVVEPVGVVAKAEQGSRTGDIVIVGIDEIVPMQAFPMESNLDFMGASQSILFLGTVANFFKSTLGKGVMLARN